MSKTMESAQQVNGLINYFNDGTPEEQGSLSEFAAKQLNRLKDERFVNDIDEYERDEYMSIITNLHEVIEGEM